MKLQLEKRLKELRTEFECGQKALADLELRQRNLYNTLLRISGAIQILEEELGKMNTENTDMSEQQVFKDRSVPLEVGTKADID